MAFFGFPRGRRKAASTIRITIDNENATDNATLYVDSDAGTTVTYEVGSWLELIASAPKVINNIEIFDSTGFVARLATGTSSTEEDLLLTMLGGNGFIPVRLDAGERLSIMPGEVPPEGSEIMINFYD